MSKRYIVKLEQHKNLVTAAFRFRGYTPEEASDWSRICSDASWHGIQSHNAIKAMHLDKLFGSKPGGCIPGAQIEVIKTPFKAAEVWNANSKCGPSVAYQAIDRCIELADEFGTGTVSVDNAFHYLWGGGYALEAARRGYIGYTACTALLAEVVPYKGRTPTLGTNPHSWSFPTTKSLGFPILIDWATSVVAMGKVQQLKREGSKFPIDCGVDANGNPTNDPEKVVALLPFGGHKGYGLSLIDELLAGYIGGSLPTRRGRYCGDDKKRSTCFFFQVTHPDAIAGKHFEKGRTTNQNITDIIEDVLGHGNENCMLPGQLEAEAARQSSEAGGLLFSETEIESFNEIASECEIEQLEFMELEI